MSVEVIIQESARSVKNENIYCSDILDKEMTDITALSDNYAELCQNQNTVNIMDEFDMMNFNFDNLNSDDMLHMSLQQFDEYIDSQIMRSTADKYNKDDISGGQIWDSESGDINEQKNSKKGMAKMGYDSKTDTFNCCNKVMVKGIDNMPKCTICGRIEEFLNEMTSDHTNTYPLKIVPYGKVASQYRSRIYSNHHADQQALRDNYLTVLLAKMQSESATIKFESSILYATKLMCLDIIKYSTFRNYVLREIIAACINEVCIRNKMYIEEPRLCKFTKLLKRGIADGNKILREMDRAGIIKLSDKSNMRACYIEGYLNSLKLQTSNNYKCVNSCVEFIIKCGINQSTLNHKCAGIIYIIALALLEIGELVLPEGITLPVYVEDRLGVKYTTFIAVVKKVKQYRSRFEQIFVRCKVRFPEML